MKETEAARKEKAILDKLNKNVVRKYQAAKIDIKKTSRYKKIANELNTPVVVEKKPKPKKKIMKSKKTK